LSSDEWRQLSEIFALLQPLKQLTLQLEGHGTSKEKGILYEILPSMDFLLTFLENQKIQLEHSEDKFLKGSVNLAWLKLDKYYNKTDLSPYYVAAVVLNPCLKWRYFEDKWQTRLDWIEMARQAAHSLWDKEYRNNSLSLVHPIQIYDEDDMLAEFMFSTIGKPSSTI
jgi:hypothetical protein